MSIQVQCPSCDKVANLPDTAAGKNARCGCGRTFPVPSPASPAAQPAAPEQDLELRLPLPSANTSDRAHSDQFPSPVPVEARPSRSRAALFTVVGVAAVMVLGCMFFYLSRGNPNSSAPTVTVVGKTSGDETTPQSDQPATVKSKAVPPPDKDTIYLAAKRAYVGDGCQRDDVEAAKLFLQAAELGHAEAQCDVGACFLAGAGVQQDGQEALKWFEKAAKAKVYRAITGQGNVYERGVGVTQDMKKAFSFYMAGANVNDVTAQYNVGLCYLKGQGVTRNPKEASRYLKMAAFHGHEQAKVLLDLYLAGGFSQ